MRGSVGREVWRGKETRHNDNTAG
ncbi:hypothetical protein Pmani_031229, partial [Petrolisthes manimaculis]